MRHPDRNARPAPLLLLLVLGLAASGCGGSNNGATTAGGAAGPPVEPVVAVTSPPRAPAAANPTVPQEPSPFRFEDVAKAAGITFVHHSGMTEEKHFPTANGSGAAILDYDGDGKMDLMFATNCLLPVGKSESQPNRLYRSKGDGTYEDVTERAGLRFRGFTHGIIAADFDNDGDPDLILCNYGPNVFYRNNGDGTFSEVSEAAGIHRDGWSSGGAPIDIDNDGDLDVYIANYGDWSLERDGKRFCGHEDKGVRQYCSPKEIRTVKHFLYRNDGVVDGVPHFTDVTDAAGVGRSDGHGFSATAADLDGDGDTDLYVANDQNPNFLFLNNGDGTFKDATEESGAAFDDRGHAQAGMGTDAEDLDGDGRPELFVTNFKDEYNTLYQNLGSAMFMDQTLILGLGADAMEWVGWGCALLDFDDDGWPDIFVANGHVDDNYNKLGLDIPYAEPALLHRNVRLGSGPKASYRFRLATRGVGPYFAGSHVGRGVAFGDLDDDGRADIVVNHKDAPPAVLMNRTPLKGNHWVRLRLVGTRSNRDAVGARIEVQAAGRTIYRQRKGGTSLESTNDPRVLIGLGPAEPIAKVTVRWPSGAVTEREGLEVDREHTIEEPKE